VRASFFGRVVVEDLGVVLRLAKKEREREREQSGCSNLAGSESGHFARFLSLPKCPRESIGTSGGDLPRPA
jgi:hypothetical protein